MLYRKGKSIRIVHRYYPEIQMLIDAAITFKQIIRLIKENWSCKIIHLRLFTRTGIELSEEDLQFLKNNDEIFVSLKGESFEIENIYYKYLIIERFPHTVIAHNEITGVKTVFKQREIEILNANSLDRVFRWIKDMKQRNYQDMNIEKCILINKSLIQIRIFQPGISFNQIARNKQLESPLSEQQAQFYFYQIGQILSKCQHRNLSLNNIIVEDDKVHLIDFNYKNNSLIYTAPECLMNDEGNSNSQDVWSFGVILYRMVFGVFPFGEQNDQFTMHKIRFCQYQFEDLKVSKQLKNLLSKIFVLSPDRRLSMKEILNHPFFSNQQQLQYTEIEQQQIVEIPKITIDPIIQMRQRLAKLTPDKSKSSRSRTHRRHQSVFY